ncbi:MAG: hypothetical protein ACOYEV_05800 [Candidatus Nanopelagicales bacterium]
MSVTAVLTAWAGFQAAKWAGQYSLDFAKSSHERMEAARYEADANKRQAIHVLLFAQWLQATEGEQRDANYLADRFPEPLKAALTAWRKADPATRAATPFEMAEYELPELAAARDLDERAMALEEAGLASGTTSESYIGTTVVFATVLFFAAMSGKMAGHRLQWAMLAVGGVLFVFESARLLVLPKLV